MKTYNIELLTSGNNAVEYIDFLQETGIARVPLTNSPQLCEVSRYIVFHVTAIPMSGNNIYINDESTGLNSTATITPGLFTHINGTAFAMVALKKGDVFVIDLEKVAQYSGIAIENITRIRFTIMED